jgi:neutral ceramidase
METKKNNRYFIFFLFLLITGVFLSSVNPKVIAETRDNKDDLQIGAAAVKITPPLGTPLAGQYYNRGAVGVHDDLYAKAIVIKKGGSKVAIVSCDLVEVTADLVSSARNKIEQSTGISGDHVMIGATHSHTGPVIPYPGNINVVKGKTAEILAVYVLKLPDLITESVKQANEALEPAKISYGLGHEETISFNRRFYMTDGTVGWNPGKLNPGIIKPAGPIDPDVSVLFAETLNGKPVSTYVNFALHLDITSGLEISADMPYTLSSILGNVKGKDMITLFAQGCSGNINHINVKSGEPQNGHAEAQRIGTVLAGEVIKTFTRLDPLAVDNISVRRKIVKLPLADISSMELSKAREIVALYGKPDAAPFMDFVTAFKTLDIYERNGNPIDAEIQVFALGDKCAIVSFPGEIFTELGMYIKSRSPYSYTMVVELSNGSIDYVPDRKAYLEGNYEPVSSRCAPGSGEILVEEALKMLNELKRASTL